MKTQIRGKTRCKACGFKTYYNQEHDSYFCKSCDEWDDMEEDNPYKGLNEFYFAVNIGTWGDLEVIVTPKDLWDNEGHWCDMSSADKFVQPLGLERLTESVYEVTNGFTVNVARERAIQLLLRAGATQNDNLLGD